jgi:hypothetical protein
MVRKVILTVVMVAVVAACGDGDEGASGDIPTASTQDPAAVQAYVDGAAIQHLGQYVTDAFAASPAEGLVALASSNYLVWNATYTAEDCIRGLRSRLGPLANARLSQTFQLDTLRPTPGRVVEAAGGVPQGRLYSVSAAITWGIMSTTTVTADVVVLPDGVAKAIRRCS